MTSMIDPEILSESLGGMPPEVQAEVVDFMERLLSDIATLPMEPADMVRVATLLAETFGGVLGRNTALTNRLETIAAERDAARELLAEKTAEVARLERELDGARCGVGRYSQGWARDAEAKDMEADRLRAEVARLEARTECRRDLPWCDCTALEREREGAKMRADAMQEEADRLGPENVALRAEVARLQRAYRSAVDARNIAMNAAVRWRSEATTGRESLTEEVTTLRAEVARLTTERDEARALLLRSHDALVSSGFSLTSLLLRDIRAALAEEEQ